MKKFFAIFATAALFVACAGNQPKAVEAVAADSVAVVDSVPAAPVAADSAAVVVDSTAVAK